MDATQRTDQFLFRAGVFVALAMLIMPALFSAGVTAILAGGLLGLLLMYAAFGLRAPAEVRQKIIWLGIAAALGAAATAAGYSLLAS